jgi:hypothetical protein
MDNTIILQGSFTSTGSAVNLILRSDVDWVRIYNATEIAAANDDHGVEYYWQRGFADNNGIVWLRNADHTAINISTSAALAVGGFSLFNTSLPMQSALRAVTGVTNANPPLVETGNTAGLVTGDVVRLYNVVGAHQLGAMDFSVGTVVANTSFQIDMSPIVNANPGAGFYRKVASIGNSVDIFRPTKYWIVEMSQGSPMIVTTSVIPLGRLQVGQEVRLYIPPVFGMVEADQLTGTIIDLGVADANGNTSTVVLDIDSSAFSAFTFPLTAAVPFTPALMIPFGENTGEALATNNNILADSVFNASELGITLMPGITSPAGSEDDEIFWVAGKSFSITEFGE